MIKSFLRIFESIFRWPHKSACVKTDSGWVCASNCPVGGRPA